MAFKPEVYVQGEWGKNALVFATEAEALISARDLMNRWTLVEDCRAVEVTDELVNATLTQVDERTYRLDLLPAKAA